MKQEKDGGDAQQPSSGSGSEADPVRVKEEEAEESRDRASVAVFGDEIASDGNIKHEDESADPQLRQDQAGSATETNAAAAAVDGLQSNLSHMAQDSKESLQQQDRPEPLRSTALADQSPSDPTMTKQQLPAVKAFTVLCRENGLLQIFALPDMQLLFSYTNPIEGPPLLTQGGSSPHQPTQEEAKERVVEARMESFGPRDASGDMLFTPILSCKMHHNAIVDDI